MQHAYFTLRLLLAALFFLGAGSADAQMAWRPFRSGLIYAFNGPGSGSAHTLRLDSAFLTTSGDSAWTFRRIAKTSNGQEQSINPYGIYRKSRNNLFGARLTWQRTPAAFMLENVAESGFQAVMVLQLRPQAAVGSTWAASTAPARTATLTSRSLQQVGGISDSVAVITLSTGQVVRLSRTYGLLEGPQWLGTAPGTAQWTQARLPATLAQSAYNPATLFDLQPGDELGYLREPFTISPFPVSESHILRRISTRQQTPDSLVYTYREQVRTQTFASPNGSMAGTQTFPIQAGRMAFSLRTGMSWQFPALPLLTGEYVNWFSSSPQAPLLVGRGISVESNGSSCHPSGLYLKFIALFSGFSAPAGQYHTGIDIGWQQGFALALGLGDMFTGETRLVYYRRTRNGTVATCGSPQAFVNLLPARAAQAAAVASLFPNPAADAAVLKLAAPARPGTRLVLRDALGRLLWQTPVPAGHTEAAVPLAGRPAGLYLLQVEQPKAASVTLRLNKE